MNVVGGLHREKQSALPPEDQLVLWLAEVADKPYDFVLGAFPWGEAGTELEERPGPEAWQCKVLQDLQANLITFDQAMRIAIRSGHGVGKSALLSWVVWWG